MGLNTEGIDRVSFDDESWSILVCSGWTRARPSLDLQSKTNNQASNWQLVQGATNPEPWLESIGSFRDVSLVSVMVLNAALRDDLPHRLKGGTLCDSCIMYGWSPNQFSSPHSSILVAVPLRVIDVSSFGV